MCVLKVDNMSALMSVSHLSSLRDKKRRERLEWLGDAVMEEAVFRLVSREAMAALEREEAGAEGFGVPEMLRPLSASLGFALRVAVSNENLTAVYEAHLAGLAGYLGLSEDRHASHGNKRCRSSGIGLPPRALGRPREVRDKRLPDLVESVIGEAFEASLQHRCWGGTSSSSEPHRLAGGHRAALMDRLLSSALSTEIFLSSLESRGTLPGGDRHEAEAFANRFSALESDEEDDNLDVATDISRSSGPPFDRNNASDQEVAGHVGDQARAGSSQTTEDKNARPDAGSAREESIDAGRETVLRWYGAALIRFRVSVFLFCSVALAEGDEEQGPSELTMRRQDVMCAGNLDAVAAHLRSLENCEEMIAAPASAPTARRWMRAAVGRSVLCPEGSPAFSTRVAALLLSRSGERSGPSLTSESSVAGAGGAGATSPASEAAVAAAAVAEAQFSRDPWQEKCLPRASKQASRMFYHRMGVSTMQGRNAYNGRSGRGDHRAAVSAGVSSILGCDSRGDGSDDDEHPTASPSPRRGRKRKRASEAGPLSPTAGRGRCVPPHYAGWVDGLPRESRELLARLGHHGYVKVLEEILDRFLRASGNTDLEEGLPSARRAAARATRLSTGTIKTLGDGTVDTAGTGATRATASAEAFANNADVDASAAQRLPDKVPDPWHALQNGKPHPSFSGLVEPAELALTGPKRMVLPIPNPFYRRVLHALCRVHGLRSCGGHTGSDCGASTARGEVIRHRTVEVMRGAFDAAVHGRPGGDGRTAAEGATARDFIPVERLLGEEI